MSGSVKIEITESPETLKTLLAQQKTVTGKERMQALYLLKTQQKEAVFGLGGLYEKSMETAHIGAGGLRDRATDEEIC